MCATGDEGDDLHLSAAVGAQQRVDLVHLLDQRRPTEAGAAAVGLVVGDRRHGDDAGAGELQQRLLERPQGVDVQIVGGRLPWTLTVEAPIL
jgi:hypothetical protein